MVTNALCWQIAESLVMVYMHGCSYFSMCDHRSLSTQLTTVFTDPANFGQYQPEWAIGLPSAAEALTCYAKRNVEMHAPRHRNLVGHVLMRCCKGPSCLWGSMLGPGLLDGPGVQECSPLAFWSDIGRGADDVALAHCWAD